MNIRSSFLIMYSPCLCPLKGHFSCLSSCLASEVTIKTILSLMSLTLFPLKCILLLFSWYVTVCSSNLSYLLMDLTVQVRAFYHRVSYQSSTEVLTTYPFFSKSPWRVFDLSLSIYFRHQLVPTPLPWLGEEFALLLMFIRVEEGNKVLTCVNSHSSKLN